MDAEQISQLMGKHEKAWFTVKDLIDLTGDQPDQLLKTLKNSQLFVHSSWKTPEGLDAFSTKKDFNEKENFARKILGAFKNRID